MRLALFCLILLFTQCSKKTANSTSVVKIDSVSLDKIVESELGASTEKLPNASNTYLLAYRLKSMTESFTSYAIFEMSTGTILKRGNYTPGYIRWLNDTSLELLNAPGALPKDKTLQDYKTIISLKKEK